MKRAYVLMTLFGFAMTLVIIVAPGFIAGNNNFSVPYGLSWATILYYYLLALTFFVIFTVAAAIRAREMHKGSPYKWFGFSLLAFSIGSWVASVAYIGLLYWFFGTMRMGVL